MIDTRPAGVSDFGRRLHPASAAGLHHAAMLLERRATGWITWLVQRDGSLPMPTERADRALIRRAQSGDPQAFETLIRSAGDRLLGIARKILRDPDAADDAFQAATITAWRKLPALRDPEHLEGWLYRILVSACYAEANRKRTFAATVRQVADSGSIDRDLHGLGERDALERAFRSVTPAHRAVVILHHYADLPLIEVATILGVSPGTARSRLHYALAALRAALEADDRPTIEELR